MHTTELIRPITTIPEVVSYGAVEINRRIDGLQHVKALCGALAPGRERHYQHVMAAAAEAANTVNASACRKALRALDLLSLELCDD